MKSYSWVFFLGMCLPSFVMGQGIPMPRTILERPKVFAFPVNRDPMDLNNTSERAELKQWLVLSDRANNYTYITPDENAGQFKVAGFLDEFVVVDERPNWIHIARDPSAQLLALSPKAEDYGWVRKDHMLLWQHCLVTEKGKINIKAMALNKITKNFRIKAGELPDIVQFRDAPSDDGVKIPGKQALVFQFYFVLKRENEWVLVGKDERTGDNPEYRMGIIMGWAPEARMTLWDTRKVVEPNWDPKAVAERKNGIHAQVYQKQTHAESCFEGKLSHDSTLIWDADPLGDRPLGEWRRLPVLEPISPNILEIGAMGSILTLQGGAEPDIRAADTRKGISDAIVKMRNINIVFVMDGTRSMGPYFKAARKGVEQCIASLQAKEGNRNRFRYGAVIYRDFLEGNRLTEPLPLQDSPQKLVEFLDPAKAVDYKDDDDPEAVNYGLREALRSIGIKENENNLLILIGDAGNHHRDDETQVAEDEIVKTMTHFGCHFLAFQVNNPGRPAYAEFVTQFANIIKKAADVDYDLTKKKYGDNLSGFQAPVLKAEGNRHIIEHGTFVGGVFGVSNGQQMQDTKLSSEVARAITAIDKQNDDLVKILENLKTGGGLTNAMPRPQQQKSAPNIYASDLPAGVYYLLRRMNVDIEAINKMKSDRFQMYAIGYSSMKTRGQKQPLFRYSLFLSRSELHEVISSLHTLSDGSNVREDLQNAWKKLVATYMGTSTSRELDELTLNEWQEKIVGLGSLNPFLANIKIQDIADRQACPDDKVMNYVASIKEKVHELDRIYNAESYPYSFRSNEIPYFWISQELLP